MSSCWKDKEQQILKVWDLWKITSNPNRQKIVKLLYFYIFQWESNKITVNRNITFLTGKVTNLTANNNMPLRADKFCDEVDLQQCILFYSIWTLHLSLSWDLIYNEQFLFLLLNSFPKTGGFIVIVLSFRISDHILSFHL